MPNLADMNVRFGNSQKTPERHQRPGFFMFSFREELFVRAFCALLHLTDHALNLTVEVRFRDLLKLHRTHLQRQTKQGDEAFRVVMIV